MESEPLEYTAGIHDDPMLWDDNADSSEEQKAYRRPGNTGSLLEQLMAVGIHFVLAGEATCFLVFEGIYYWKNTSWTIPVVYACLVVWAWCLLLLSECRDPGIIPSTLWGLTFR